MGRRESVIGVNQGRENLKYPKEVTINGDLNAIQGVS